MSFSRKNIVISSILVTGANILENLIFLAVTIMVARYLSPDQYGEYATAIGVATFFISFCDIGINQSFIRALSMGKDDPAKTAGTMFILKILLSLVTYGVLCADLFVTGYSATTIELTCIFGIVRLCSDCIRTFLDYFDAQKRFIVSTLFKLSFSLSLLLVTVGAIYFDKGYYALFLYRLAAAVTVMIVISFAVLRKVKRYPEFDRAYTWNFIRLSLPFGISNALSNAFQRITIIILSVIMGTTAVGLFNNAFIFLTSLLFVPKSISRVLLPFLYRVDQKSRNTNFQSVLDTYARYMSIAGFFAACMLFISSDSVIPMLFGKKYADSVPMLKITACAIPFIFTVADSVLIAFDRQRAKMFIELSVLTVSLVSSVFLIPHFGGEGAALTALLAYFLIYVGYHVYLYFILNVSVKLVASVNLKLSGLSLAVWFIWNHISSVYGLIVSMSIVAVLYFIGAIVLLFSRRELSLLFIACKGLFVKKCASGEAC
jgi:O-antigen/teichoic acid export membrane protein